VKTLLTDNHFLRDLHVTVVPMNNANASEKVGSTDSNKTLIPDCSSMRSVNSKVSIASTNYSTSSTIKADTQSRSVMVTEDKLPFLIDRVLLSYFGKFGDILKISHPKKATKGTHRYFFIKFNSYEAAKKSIGKANLHNKTMKRFTNSITTFIF
jgi:hypothetical protein